MSIIIRKQESGEVFDLPKDYTIESERNNPAFESKGSQTVTINFPATNNNKKLLCFPERLDRIDRMNEPVAVIVESGPVQQRGLLAVGSAGGGSISANIGYDESEMYNKMKEIPLRDIPELPVVDKGGASLAGRVDSILSHLTAVMKEQEETDYYVFPVCVKTYTTKDENEVEHQFYEVLNNINTGYENTGVGLGELLALEDRVIMRTDNDDPIVISVPKGYGVTAFLKIGAILELIFRQYGYTIDENSFKTHRQLKKLVVLNNTSDAVITGRLYYKDMMPDISIQEFLDALYAKFGMVYYVNSTKKTIDIKFLRDIVDPVQSGSNDLTSKITEEPVISYSNPKQIRLKANRLSIEDKKQSADVLFDTFEELLEKFNYRISQAFSVNERYARYTVYNIFQFDANNSDNPQFRYSSDFFDWDKKTKGVDYEEIEQKDLCLPFSKYDLLFLLNYAVDCKLSYSDLIVGGEKQDGVVNLAKLAFAFGWGNQRIGRVNQFFASQINRDINGEFMSDSAGNMYDISLTNNREDGLYNRFWKNYDAFIRHSNQEVSCKMYLPDLEILSLKLHQSVFIKNQPFIIKKIKYKQNIQGQEAELILRTLRLYEADNLEKEQKIPILIPLEGPYYWDISQSEDKTPISGYGNPKFIENVYDSKYYEINGVNVPISEVSYFAPTIAQYGAREVRIYRYRKIYRVSILGIERKISTTVTVRFSAASNMIYP